MVDGGFLEEVEKSRQNTKGTHIMYLIPLSVGVLFFKGKEKPEIPVDSHISPFPPSPYPSSPYSVAFLSYLFATAAVANLHPRGHTWPPKQRVLSYSKTPLILAEAAK